VYARFFFIHTLAIIVPIQTKQHPVLNSHEYIQETSLRQGQLYQESQVLGFDDDSHQSASTSNTAMGKLVNITRWTFHNISTTANIGMIKNQTIEFTASPSIPNNAL
jgi:hypothetical protein